MATKTTTVAVPTKGSTVTDSQGRTGVAKFNPNTGQALTSSTSVRADNNATGADIRGLQSAYAQSNAVLQAEQARQAELRTQTINDIKTQSAIDEVGQANRQNFDYGARSTSLITSGGGFLGATQSQQGVLQNLKGTFDAEHTALIAKRDAAVNAANAAYSDKDFALAKELANNAKDLQNQIYKTQSDFADQQLKIAAANRAQTEFDMGITNQWLSIASKYPGAGINSADTFDSVQQKIRNSPEYKLDQRKSEADLANTYSLIKDRANNNSSTFSTKPLSVAEIIQYQNDYPDAGIKIGDSPASIQAKINPTKPKWDDVYKAAINQGASKAQAISSANSITGETSLNASF